MLLAFYLDNVLPGGDSPARRPWYFLLTRTFWWPPKVLAEALECLQFLRSLAQSIPGCIS